MQYGFVIPGGVARTAADLAAEAEAAGWDGVFFPDCIAVESEGATYGQDPWVVLTAMAMQTERVRLGPMITPLSRRRPWKVARETMTLDHLSKGRLILPVGLGALSDSGFDKVGEATDRKTRAAMMDESLAILGGLWSGQPFGFQGTHYQFAEMTFLPPSLQQPRIPVWVVATWPRPKTMDRALRWDGLVPRVLGPDGEPTDTTPDDIRAMRAYVQEHRTATTPFDIIFEGRTPGDDRTAAVAQVQPYIDAGITWWLEAMWTEPNSLADQHTRIRQGPPRNA